MAEIKDRTCFVFFLVFVFCFLFFLSEREHVKIWRWCQRMKELDFGGKKYVFYLLSFCSKNLDTIPK